ncbi:RNA polymerase sigma-70 factor [Rubrivirga sp.]|uniref:RNA polymerase sigma-70 factor n=1 Tax=Rubrivirga sp. TaxID=1885344 RepID=UPI003B51BB6D
MTDTPDPSALAARVRSGDRAAFEALFRSAWGDLARYARTLADPAEADDAVQDALLTLWRRRADLDPDRSVRALLYTAVRNRLLNRQRDHARRRDLLDTMDAPASPPLPDATTEASLLGALVRDRLATLPDRQREAFGLSRFDGLSHAEIADVMGCSAKTVENHVGRALAALRDHLRRHAPDAFL